MYQSTTIVGNLGRDPEVRDAGNGTVTNFSVAVNESWTSDGQKHEKVTWFKVAAWGRLGETCARYLDKGRMVLVTGEIQSPDVYQNKNGEWRASLELRARTVKFLGGTPKEEEDEIPF